MTLLANTGTPAGTPLAPSVGKRSYATNAAGTAEGYVTEQDGYVRADDFATVAAMVTYCEANNPLTVRLGRGEYDFTGLTVPVGTTFQGVGLVWNSGFSNGGFSANASIITGAPLQQTGSSINKFVGVVFDGGFTVRKQNTVFEHCAFVGGSLIFEGDGAAPYYSTVDKCIFRGTPSATNVVFNGAANAISITNSQFLVGSGQRGIEGIAVSTAVPVSVHVTACGFETGESSIGSFIYGDFLSSTFDMMYFDTSRPTFTDGGEVVLTSKSRVNKVRLPNATGDTFGDTGVADTFEGATLGTIYSNVNTFNFADRSGLADMYILGASVATATMAPIVRGQSRATKVTSIRSGGTTLSAAGSETINGGASLAIAQNEIYLMFGAAYFGTPITNWTAVRIG